MPGFWVDASPTRFFCLITVTRQPGQRLIAVITLNENFAVFSRATRATGRLQCFG